MIFLVLKTKTSLSKTCLSKLDGYKNKVHLKINNS